MRGGVVDPASLPAGGVVVEPPSSPLLASSPVGAEELSSCPLHVVQGPPDDPPDELEDPTEASPPPCPDPCDVVSGLPNEPLVLFAHPVQAERAASAAIDSGQTRFLILSPR